MRRIKPPASAGDIHPFRLRLLDEEQPAAACLDQPTNLFYPHPGEEHLTEQAKAVCKRCPVVVQCLEYAFDVGDQWAVLGGMAPGERYRFKRQLDRALAA